MNSHKLQTGEKKINMFPEVSPPCAMEQNQPAPSSIRLTANKLVMKYAETQQLALCY